ncbi:L-threonylcarbamoyladenylate synthase [Clostridium folliculivorans]|uniref:Threonylcarbamoyl-AMP synthase n=1 Tax=Clostridium folliculivorans TaxID=2886038 RepID=A0A9W5XYI9_9CLOT|nr:L-threonylcarbamoyladenylate synthase [Clostridium folliculivorans]GKU23302.1 threonylcarbamoyl-AMP synthase [Clostridium folliculivorans]GKU29419.1 threonylcarbamoyl-AMP synthase [Clostridium folliculivorans]
MKTEVRIINNIEENVDDIKRAAESIKNGGTVVFPTETVYGLGADALNEDAVKKIFIAKGRPQDNPLIIHVASKDIEKYVEDIPEVAEKLMNKFWPGPLTILFNKKAIIPDITSAGLSTIGIRMPEDKLALKLIQLSKTAIAAPSANISGRPSPTDIYRCIEDLNEKVDFIIGGNESDVGLESTIIDCTVTPPCVLRPGGITLDMLKEVDPDVYIDAAIMKKPSEDIKPKAPGMKYRHYAPKAKVSIVEGSLEKSVEKINEIVQNYIEKGFTVGIMATEETKNLYKEGNVISLGSRNNIEEVAKNLFETLRKFDDSAVDYIISEAFTEDGIGLAIMNRLRKAAGFDIIKA